MPHAFLDEVKKAITSNLPSTSGVVGEVVKVIYNTTSSAKDLAAVIERDPPLTAHILKIANSAYYSPSSEVTSIQRAIVVLGFDTIKELSTTVTVVHYLFRGEHGEDIDLPGLWLHSVGTAKASQLICQTVKKERPDVAYTAGLLHDIGKILLSLSFAEHYNRVVHLSQEKSARIILAERRLLNTDHAMVGRVLCDIWGLPEKISSAIFYHHEPMRAPKESKTLSGIIALGNVISRQVGIGNPGDGTVQEPGNALLRILGNTEHLYTRRYNEIVENLEADKEEIESFFLGLQR